MDSKVTKNKVKNRFLFLAPSVEAGLENEAKFNDFEIKSMLGEGSFGKVYLVKHKKTGANYAIKAIDKRNKNNQEGKPYFSREIEIMYKVTHPNIVRLYTHFEDDDYIYFVMEYIGKGNLFTVLTKEKALTASAVANYMKDVISSVYYLHHMIPIIIHRDIKPENVLLHSDGKVKLTDFGWSNYTNDNEVRDTYCGTPVYLAPEMISGVGHDDKLDIWCIGVLMFELLTGKTPFSGNNTKELNINIQQLKINWPRDINLDGKNIITKILKLNPLERISLEDMLKHPFFTKHISLQVLQELLIKPNDVELDSKIYLIHEHLPQAYDSDKFKIKKKLLEKPLSNKVINTYPNINENKQNSLEGNNNNNNGNGNKNSNNSNHNISNNSINLLYDQLKKDYEKLQFEYQELQKIKSNQSNSSNKEDILNIEAIFISQKKNLERELEEKDNEKFSLQKLNADLNSKIKEQENILRENKETLKNLEEKKLKSEKEVLKLTEELNTVKTEKETILKENENTILDLEETIDSLRQTRQSNLDDINESKFKEYEQIKDNKEKEKLSIQLKHKDEEIKKLMEEKIQIKENEFKKFEKILNKTELQLKLKESEVENLKVKIIKLENIITVSKNAQK